MPSTTQARDYDSMPREELYRLAQQRDVPGRSEMSKEELAEALRLDDVGPDAVDLLLEQHARIRELFDRFAELSDRPSQKKEDLVREIVTILVKHGEIEEQIFYPAIRLEIDGAGDEADEGLEEHHASELLLAEIDGLASSATRYDAKVHVMVEHMRHHLEEEEEDLFPLVRRELSEERRRQIGAAMVEQWKVAPTRPHPRLPQTPPGNVLLNLPQTAWDVTVGAVRWSGRRLRGLLPKR